jgi:hypothetical protein
MQNIRQFGVFDDFVDWEAAFIWNEESADTSAAIAHDADGVGGILTLTTGTTDNMECYMYSNEIFKVATGKPIIAVARLKFDDGGTANAGAVIFGLADVATTDTNIILDDEGGPVAEYHGALIFKNSGAATIAVESTSSASNAQNVTTTENSMADDTWESWMIVIQPLGTNDKRVTFFRDSAGGVNFKQMKDSDGHLIEQKWTLADQSAGTGEMALLVGVKTSSAEAAVVTVDYMGAWQLR